MGRRMSADVEGGRDQYLRAFGSRRAIENIVVSVYRHLRHTPNATFVRETRLVSTQPRSGHTTMPSATFSSQPSANSAACPSGGLEGRRDGLVLGERFRAVQVEGLEHGLVANAEEVGRLVGFVVDGGP